MTEQIQKSDAELLAGFIRNSDGTALDELVKRYAPMVFRTGYRILHDVHEAEDVAQAAFMVMAGKAESLKNVSNLAAGLHSVAGNAAKNALRTKIRRRTREQQSMDFLSTQSSDGPGTMQETLFQNLDQELDRLSGNQRQAVILRYLQGYSEREAAEIAGCTIDALSRRAYDGIAMLRKRLSRVNPALGASIVPLLNNEAKVQVSSTLLSSVKTAALSARAGALTAGGTNAGILAKGVITMMFWNKVKIAAVAAIAIAAIPSTFLVIANTNTLNKNTENTDNIADSANADSAVKPETTEVPAHKTLNSILAKSGTDRDIKSSKRIYLNQSKK